MTYKSDDTVGPLHKLYTAWTHLHEDDSFFSAISTYALRRLHGDADQAHNVVLKVLTWVRKGKPITNADRFVNHLITCEKSYQWRKDAHQPAEFDDDTYATDSGVPVYDPSQIEDHYLRNIAELLLFGYTRADIEQELEIKTNTLNKRVQRYRKRCRKDM